MSTDSEWEKWGQKDPYFGVITNDRFRTGNLDTQAKADFFESGQWHVQHVWSIFQRHVDSTFAPRNVLDFGCGVGRLVIPFAVRVEHVVGLDVSDSMLMEARRNCDLYGITNAKLAKSDDALSELDQTFDLIHSSIVFQHIEPERGRRIFAGLLSHLAVGGFGAIQVTYAKTIHSETWGASPPPPQLPIVNLSNDVPLAKDKRRGILKILSGSTPVAVKKVDAVFKPEVILNDSTDPEMQMNSYNLNDLIFALQRSGVERFHTEFTDHGGELGVFLFFQKSNK